MTAGAAAACPVPRAAPESGHKREICNFAALFATMVFKGLRIMSGRGVKKMKIEAPK
jgi:hypothetical protein